MTEATASGLLQTRPGRIAAVKHAFRRWPIIPAFIILTLVVCGVFAPWVAPQDHLKSSLRDRNAPPVWYEEGSSKYILGADPLGRDVLSRIVFGARITLIIGVVSIAAGLLVGTVLGLISGYLGKHVDEFIMRLADISLAVPYILIALVAVIAFGQSLPVLLGILAFSTWSAFARQVRAETLVLKETDYVALAKVAGASGPRIIYRHILPGVLNTIIVIATLRVGALILFEAILSFLGAGIPPPTPSWGSMVSDGRDYLATAWWVAFFPGIAIFLTVAALNFLGDWMRDRLDPRLRQI
jgi:peptide/nickel transport system permease protein